MKTLRLWKTKEFGKWIDKRHPSTRARIYSRINRAAATGHFGDHEGVGDNVSEMRLDFDHGYRVYYHIMEDDRLLLLLIGGDKSTQKRDIERAKKLLPDAIAKAKKELEEEKQRERTEI